MPQVNHAAILGDALKGAFRTLSALPPDLASVGDATAARRTATLSLIEDYLTRAGSTEPRTLARFFGAIIQDMSVQARDGATEEELTALADVAMAAWR